MSEADANDTGVGDQLVLHPAERGNTGVDHGDDLLIVADAQLRAGAVPQPILRPRHPRHHHRCPQHMAALVGESLATDRFPAPAPVTIATFAGQVWMVQPAAANVLAFGSPRT